MESASLVGQTVSHYRISAKLGEGGMGAVYRAEDLSLGREVALKFLPPEAASNPLARKRLLKEAQAASRLNHPNIATVYEVSADGETPFISMELVSGETLKQKLQAAALPPAQFLQTAVQIAEGLREAHRAGVLHRDIKPGNIMLDSRSRVKILDFGLAELGRRQRAEGETEEVFVTRTATSGSTAAAGSTGGTVPYMSPEQLRGEPTDARSDIFSFGVLLYECLTGRLPFRGETSIDVLHAILRSPHAPLRTLLPDIEPEWEKLIDRCLAKSPAQRCGSMDEILDMLARVPSPTLRPEKSVAVLYFANLGGGKDDEYFRDGMTEDIITELTKIKELRMLPRSAVVAFRDKSISAAHIAQQLAAAYVLDGSIRRSGNRLRITAQLAETRTGHSVWAERYDRQLEDVFAIQDEMAQNIARALRVVLSDEEKQEIEKVPTRDVQAYDYYLRGRKAFYEFRRKELEFARQMFARAIVLDPAYANAYAGVADSSSFLYMYCDATENNLKEAVGASRRAVQLDPQSAEAHASLGLAESLGKNYGESEKEFEKAIALNPKLYDAYYFYARSCFAQGRMEQAAKLFAKAADVNPDDYQSAGHLAMCYFALGRDEVAARAVRHAMTINERHVQLFPNDARALYLGATMAWRIGERARSLDWAERALAIDPEETAILYNVACTYALMGEKERALSTLEKAVRNGFSHKEWIENDPDFVSIRPEPRFKALLESLTKSSSGSETRS